MKKITTLLLFVSMCSFAQKMNYSTYNQFLAKYVTLTGDVNYDQIKANKAELDAVIVAFEKVTPEKTWTINEIKTYWINSYNIHTIKLVIDNYPIKSLMDVKEAWKINFIEYKGIKTSLDYIENDILRKLKDPRIHFAINSAAKSSPILNNETYEVTTIDKQLDNAARLFINDKTRNDITPQKANLSKAFEWYLRDFVAKKNHIDFINQYSVVKISDKTEITFQEFNWELNK
jgi:hypothetical protein